MTYISKFIRYLLYQILSNYRVRLSMMYRGHYTVARKYEFHV